MSERDFVERLGDELEAAAARRAARRRRVPWPRRRGGRALVLVGGALLLGAGGTAGLLAARGEVGGPPSLTFARLSPEQRAAGVRPLTRPVVFARGRLTFDGRLWQLIGFQTTRGLCIEIDFPQQGRAGGCGSPRPRGGRPVDWQAQIGLARLRAGLVLGAVDPAAESVLIRGYRARVVHVRSPRLLAAMSVREPFAYYLAELGRHFNRTRAEARDANGRLLGRAGIPYAMGDTSAGITFGGRGCTPSRRRDPRPPRLVPGLPPAPVRQRIAALRRPQRARDLPPRWFMRNITGTPLYATIQADAIRLMRRSADGTGYYLVPVTQRPFPLVPDSGCLRTLTPRQRDRERMLQRRADASARRLAVTLYAIGRRGGGTATTFDLDALRRGFAYYGTRGRQIVGMAPDGVARVELRFDGGTRRVVPVVGNVWIALEPRVDDRMVKRPRAVLFLDADGRVLRRLR